MRAAKLIIIMTDGINVAQADISLCSLRKSTIETSKEGFIIYRIGFLIIFEASKTLIAVIGVRDGIG